MTTVAGATVEEILDSQRTAFVTDGIPDAATRIDRVRRLQAMVLDHAEELVAALAEDFGTRAREVSMLADVIGCMGDLEYQKKHLRSWMRTRSRGRLLSGSGLRQQIRRDPLGVVGVMGPWNFPVQLTMLPAGTALAAGNRVMVRPSEITAVTTALLADLAKQYFPVEELTVLTDEQADGPTFAAQPFDHLFFTGSPTVGARVAQAAGANLVPVTLELGGKNPAVVDRSADLPKAAARIAASRMVNGGQVCMCPDYVLVQEEGLDTFVDEVMSQWRSAFPRIVDNGDYTSVISERHFDHVVGLVDDAVARGAERRQHIPHGETLPDRGTRKIAPTILTGVPSDARVNREEIFGPVLVIHPYQTLSDAVDYVNASPHPLTVYWYGADNDRFHRLQDATRSGSVNANDFTLNFIGSELPFGGVGRSGTGAYRGRAGFDTFTHARGVAFSRWPVSLARMMAPPFGRRDGRLVDLQLTAFRRRLRRSGGAR
ncbi:aldehyde dehydrogenase family protein [Mycolicibacterium arenosum]|uniref:Aldehyde dehydrogenase n=1 Tax=Mycolicibacterium arenosum TaxID=2952157 RepID=A0ABT1M4C8_9MYCO|nr:aldehyde dehydrogenase family protein [Mycolicibacterium sp. CAU 1645]MCP9273652.1 aldehyde dehydrogenase family protein [Mycolicibacterium sp. CAU 1645]